MGTKKLLNTSSSPPIAYKRYSNNSEEHKPLQEEQQSQQQNHHQQQQYSSSSSNNNKKISNRNLNNTCLLVKQNTNTMFTKFKNYFTQLRITTDFHHHHQKYAQRKRHQHHSYRHEKLTECHSIPIVQNNTMNLVTIVVTLVFLASFSGVSANPVFVDNPSLAQFQSGRNIRHLPCIVRKSGRSGVCMFAIDCIKQNGTHLGTCIDRFYFGSCCDIKEEEQLTEISDNSIDQNTISHHFTPEASTLPTSALFKLTTLNPLHQHSNTSSTSSITSISNSSSSSSSSSSSTSLTTQSDNTQMMNSITQSLATTVTDTPRPTTLVTKPVRTSTTTKPVQQTTHKQSHFVIRTTAKPTKYTAGAKPSHNTTTKKKTTPYTTTTKKATTTTTTTTTTRRPMLTTTEATEQSDELEVTTPPTKLFTYQIVETTANTPTEATNLFEFITTERGPHRTTRPPLITTSKPTTTVKETTTSTTAAATTHRFTTIKPKPQITRKPTTTKKPTSIKRTTVKPTRRPIITTTTLPTTTDLKIPAHNTTTSTTQTFQTSSTSSQTQTSSTTTASNKTTLAPRPRPKPTASIIKVPKPIITTTTKATPKPSTTSTSTTTPTTSTTTATTTESEKIVPPSTTTTTSTTKIPTSASTTSTTSTTHKTTTTTHKTTHKPVLSSTTHKPGLVTWTNINGEPVDTNQPVISDWVPVTSEQPLNTHNKVEESSSENATFEEIDVSVSSSVSAMINNTNVIISPPNKPVLMPKPTTSTSSTTTSSTEYIPTATTTTKPLVVSTSQPDITSTAEGISSTEGISPSTTTSPSGGFTTEEMSTENLNLNSTTTAPITGLEGVDYRQVCGRRMFPEPRIVGGSNAAFGRWPWQISLRQWRTSTYLHKCGAALLNENWAITAAHCVDNVPPSDLLLRLGEYDLAEEEEPYGYQERRVQIVASHPQFDPRTFEYDLALLRFYEPVVFQPNIIPVCVPENDEDFIGQTAFVTGWGRLYEDGPLPSVLQEVAVPVINNTICESMYRAAGYIEHIPHIFICAGWKKGGYDSCEGDSGGPMVLQRESDKRFQLGGVISWGIGCAEANQPGVYTRISEFRDWINQILQF